MDWTNVGRFDNRLGFTWDGLFWTETISTISAAITTGIHSILHSLACYTKIAWWDTTVTFYENNFSFTESSSKSSCFSFSYTNKTYFTYTWVTQKSFYSYRNKVPLSMVARVQNFPGLNKTCNVFVRSMIAEEKNSRSKKSMRSWSVRCCGRLPTNTCWLSG